MLLTEAYTLNELREYIRTQLGAAVWRLEGMSLDNNNTIDSAISRAVMAYSRRVPRFGWQILAPSAVQKYKLKQPGFGVWRVDFIEQNVIPGVIAGLNYNLTGVNALGVGATGAGDITQFLTWQRSYRRATTNDPRWIWNDDEQELYIWSHHFRQACVYTFLPRSFDQVRMVHKEFIMRYSMAHAKHILGTMRRKFNGSIAGPGGSTITMDSDALLTEANAELEKLHEELRSFQIRIPPSWD